MISKLDLYILNSDNSVAPFPSEAEQIVLYDFAFEAQRMGSAPEITATIQANGSLENYLTTKVFCEYNGERYFLKNFPSSSKENTDPRYTFDLTFVSERTILDNVYMIDAVQGDSNIDRYQSNSTKIVFTGTISEYVGKLNAAMTYAGVGYSIVIDEGISSDSYLISFERKVFTEALQEIPNIYKVPYYYVGKQIHIGWAERNIEQVVKYADGLLGISKSIVNTTIITRATGVGSSENIPYYYPNPTPLGTIEAVSDANVTLVDPYKFSKIPSGNKLRYYQNTASVEMLHYANATISDDGSIIAAPYQEQISLPRETEVLSGALIRCSTIDGYSRPVKVSFDYSLISGETPVRDIQRVNYAVYKYSELDGKIVLTEDLSVKVSKDVSAEGEFCFIENFPPDTDRYVMAVYSNMSGWDAVLKPRVTVSLYSDTDRAGWWFVSPTGVRRERIPDLSKYGLSVSGDIEEGTEISLLVVKTVPFSQNLLPPIYRENGERFYNAINGAYELDGIPVDFENEYEESAPKEGMVTLDNVKPTIKGITNDLGLPIDMFSAFAYDSYDDDSTTSKGDSEEYNHPYFYGKLRRFDGDYGFNLFEQALETGEMTIEMTSGACGACKFTIVVDSNTQRNLVMVDDNGDLIFDPATGNVMMSEDPQGLPAQNDTRNNEVWIALKKDVNTYGQIMPNVAYSHYPSAGDSFVITNINLPEVYIVKAEKEVKDGIIKFIFDNNRYRYNFDINFSRIFLKKNASLASQLNENATLGVEYNGKEYRFYITSFAFRKSKGELLPEISVALSDEIGTDTSSFSRSISEVKLDTQRYISSKAYIDELSKVFLRKDMADKDAWPVIFEDKVEFSKQISSKGFKTGVINGQGASMYKDANGLYVVEADRIIVRTAIEGAGFSNNPVSSAGIVTVKGDQNVEGIKNFANGLKIGNSLITYNAEKNVFILTANLLVEGGVAWNSSIEGFEPKTITDAVMIDGSTLGINENGEIYVKGGAGGGGSIAYPLSWSGYSSGVYDGSASANIAIPSLLSQMTNDSDYITSASVNSLLTDYVQKSGLPVYGLRASSSVGKVYLQKDGVDVANATLALPTKLSDLTNDKIYNRLTIDALGDYIGLHIVNSKELCGIRFSNGNTSDSGNLIYLGGTDYYVTNDGWTAVYKLLHAGNYSSYALPITGGTLTGNITAPTFIGALQGNAATATNAARLSGLPLVDKWDGANSGIPYLSSTGVMELGRVIDFHLAWEPSGTDFATRLRCHESVTGVQVYLPSTSGTLALTSDIPTKLSQLTDDVVKGNYLSTSGGTVNGNISATTFLPTGDIAIQFPEGEYIDKWGNIVFSPTSGAWSVIDSNRNNKFVVWADGRVDTSNSLTVNGNILATGEITQHSSLELKDVTDTRFLTLDELAELKPYSFYWKDGRDDKLHAGAVADYVKPILPEVISTDKDNIHSMNYANAAWVVSTSLTPYVSKHEEEIAQLKARVRYLERKLKEC